jgi:hypothetical protein
MRSMVEGVTPGAPSLALLPHHHPTGGTSPDGEEKDATGISADWS